MYKAAFAILVLSLLPVQSGFSAELTDTVPALTVLQSGDSQFVYRDADGYTVVVGQIVNNNESTSVTGIQLRANFFDDLSPYPLESNTGGTVLEVIPPLGSSPYVIKSQSPNSAITQAVVHLDGFDSSQSKLNHLSVEERNVSHVNGVLSFTGTLKNVESAPVSDARVHVAFYDGFKPPRMIMVHTIQLGNMLPNETVEFDFAEKISSRAAGFYLFSESSTFYSDFTNVSVPAPENLAKLATIYNVTVSDMYGRDIPVAKVGTPVYIGSESWLQSPENPSGMTPFTYFVQIKQVGPTPYVEFLGQYDDMYKGEDPKFMSVEWVPDSAGEFFIETFVWDRHYVPIAKQGPFVLISVK